MKAKIFGTRGRNFNVEHEIEIVEKLGENDYLIKWADGRSARFCGMRVWRSVGTKFVTLLTDAWIEV